MFFYIWIKLNIQSFMKHTFLLFISFISTLSCLGQDINPEKLNIKLTDDQKVIWQKIYEVEFSGDTLIRNIKSLLRNNILTDQFDYEDNLFTGQINNAKLSDRSKIAVGGFTPYTARIKINIKDNKYRVTVSDIVFGGLPRGRSTYDPNTLEDLVLKNKNNEFKKNNAVLNILVVLDKDLDEYFALKKDSKDNDW
jgi:hypothetical protein